MREADGGLALRETPDTWLFHGSTAMTRQEIPITPSVLHWAIDQSGMDVRELARTTKLKPDDLADWLAGKAMLGKTELRKIADKLRRPIATFLLPEPPRGPRSGVRFRAAEDNGRSHMNPVEAAAVREVARLQRVLSWSQAELAATPVDLPRASFDQPPEAVAERVRRRLHLDEGTRTGWTTSGAALKGWRSALEDLGLLVFQLPIGKDAVRGFSLWDERTPAIAVNTAWNEEARAFSLLHELGHLLTRTNSVCLEATHGTRLAKASDRDERWCERFAACVLLPWDSVRDRLTSKHGWREGTKQNDLSVASELARFFHASLAATVIRLIEHDVTDWTLFAQIPRRAHQKKDGGGGGGRSRLQTRRDQYGGRVGRLFLRALESDVLGRDDVLGYLRISDEQLDAMPALVE